MQNKTVMILILYSCLARALSILIAAASLISARFRTRASRVARAGPAARVAVVVGSASVAVRPRISLVAPARAGHGLALRRHRPGRGAVAVLETKQ